MRVHEQRYRVVHAVVYPGAWWVYMGIYMGIWVHIRVYMGAYMGIYGCGRPGTLAQALPGGQEARLAKVSPPGGYPLGHGEVRR